MRPHTRRSPQTPDTRRASLPAAPRRAGCCAGPLHGNSPRMTARRTPSADAGVPKISSSRSGCCSSGYECTCSTSSPSASSSHAQRLCSRAHPSVASTPGCSACTRSLRRETISAMTSNGSGRRTRELRSRFPFLDDEVGLVHELVGERSPSPDRRARRRGRSGARAARTRPRTARRGRRQSAARRRGPTAVAPRATRRSPDRQPSRAGR